MRILKGLGKTHSGERGHVCLWVMTRKNHFQEWCCARNWMIHCLLPQSWVRWVWASLFITSVHHHHFALSVPLSNHPWIGMHYHQVEWKSVQTSLFIILSPDHSLSNTTREHSRNAPQPNRSDFKLGKSIHYFILWQSLFNSSEA